MVLKTNWRAVKPADDPKRFVDPYYEWTKATKLAYYGPGEKLPMLVELDISKEADLDRLAEIGDAQQEFVQQLKAHRRLLRDRSGGLANYLSIFHSKENLSADRSFAEHAGIKRYQLCRAGKAAQSVSQPGKRKRRKAKGVQQAQQPGNAGNAAGSQPRIVVSGIIDDGIAFAHERFRGADGKTRVAWFWDQSDPPANPPTPWAYGRELSKQDIDALLTQCTHGGLADEEDIYRRSGLTDQGLSGHKPLAMRAAHGTVAADIACGGDASDPRTSNPIIAVQLPVSTTADTSGGTLAKFAYDGIDYILRRADLVAQQNGLATVPVVINLSYGLFAGPHNGQSLLETAIDDFIKSRIPSAGGKSELCVVIPAGNAYLSRCHANVPLKAGAERTLHWRVLPDDRTESFLEIWLPKADQAGTPPQVEVTVTTPTGDAVVLSLQEPGYQWMCGTAPVCSVMRYTAVQTQDRELIAFSLAPTASPEGVVPVAPAGIWQIKIKNLGSAAIDDVNAWIQRDDTPYGYPRRGRQSYFDDPKYQRLDETGREIEDDNSPATDSYARRNGSINAIATGQGPIVIGGLRRSDRRCAKYSAAGPVVHPRGRGAPSDDGPDAVGASEDSVACHGVLAAGARSGSTVAMNGTSVAAPRIARALVDYMIANPNSMPDRQTVFDWACQADGNAAQCVADVRRGGGRLAFPPIAPTAPIKRVDEP